jgi:predicted metal-dependent phosphoesterase TrpH
MIDLHSHTTASDGEHPASMLMELARAAGVTHLAVTDHDTVDGLEIAEREASAHGITLVPGIEISAFMHGRELHILGHFVDRRNAALASFGARLREERTRRMTEMVERARQMGYPITMNDVLFIAGDANLGRPHLARVFVEKGWCLDVREAFDRFLGDGKPVWVDRFRLTTKEAIDLIHGAGGTATVAHPGVNKVEKFELEKLKAEGLDGVEVMHSDHHPGQKEKYLQICATLELVATAGSDFHGEKVAPGRRLGTASMDPVLFAQLQARRRVA